VNSHPVGIYAMVAAATASSTFEGVATVADLWASLHGWPTPHHLFGTDRPRCIALESVRVPGDARSPLKQVAGPTHAGLRFKKLDVDELPAE
jgi:hypothetical protein